jgi:hypothetical protein
MTVDPKNLIAAISPDVYCNPEKRSKVKEIVKKEGVLKAATEAELVESEYMDVIYESFRESPFSKKGLKSPLEKHIVSYEASSQTLEPLYFWLIENINKNYKSSEKLIDNFVASPGSGFFSELSSKATRMQEEGMKILGAANTVLRSILNIIYDLKEFKLRLSTYDDYHSKERNKQEAALLSLKQIWIDSVDIKRANTSIKAMAQNFDYVTLIDAFMISNLDNVKNLDLNDRVKRILQQRLSEFYKWVEESEKELRKRYQIETHYLKSQVSSLKLYSRWAKPYLISAKQLEQNLSPNSIMVNTFNTALFELVVLGKGKYDPKDDINNGELPKYFDNPKNRKFIPIILSTLKFTSTPERTDQRGGYQYKGEAELEFVGVALREDELNTFKEQLEKDNVGDLTMLLENITSNSLSQVQEDIDFFLNEEKQEKKQEEKEDTNDTNPFSALFSIFKSKKKEIDKSDINVKDSTEESILRSQAILIARRECRGIYMDFKKSLEMPSPPPVTEY